MFKVFVCDRNIMLTYGDSIPPYKMVKGTQTSRVEKQGQPGVKPLDTTVLGSALKSMCLSCWARAGGPWWGLHMRFFFL